MDIGDIDTKKLLPKLEELILDQVRDSLPGKEKLKKVVNLAADWLAAQTKIPIPDAIESAVYRMILWIPAQMAYDGLKKLGKV